MLGVHIWKPGNVRSGLIWNSEEKEYQLKSLKNPEEFFFEDYETIVTYLSVLNWKKYNGKIKLYTNKLGFENFEKLKMTHLWDEIDVTLLEQQDQKYNINSQIFWAACKLQVIQEINEPFTVLDLDLYVEKNLTEAGFFTQQLGILHFEDSSLSYPFPYTMPTPNNFSFPKEWDWSSYAINAAMVYFGDLDFKNRYAEMSLNYMHNNNGKYIMDKLNARMIFAEQRILGEMVYQEKIKYVNIIDGLFYPRHDSDNTYGFVDVLNFRTAKFKESEDASSIHYHTNIKEVETFISHLWGLKQVLSQDLMMRMSFTRRLLEKFIRDFPNEYEDLKNSLEILYASANKHLQTVS